MKLGRIWKELKKNIWRIPEETAHSYKLLEKERMLKMPLKSSKTYRKEDQECKGKVLSKKASKRSKSSKRR